MDALQNPYFQSFHYAHRLHRSRWCFVPVCVDLHLWTLVHIEAGELGFEKYHGAVEGEA